jgi:hypothetical protein
LLYILIYRKLYIATYRLQKRISKKELLEKNSLIVKDSDIIIAFWDTKSRIVLDAIRKTAEVFEKDFFIEWVAAES